VGYVLFGWLSDKVGRKPVMLFGMTLMLAAYFPGFHMLAQTLNPALAEAEARNPATIIADPRLLSAVRSRGQDSFTSSCDIARARSPTPGSPTPASRTARVAGRGAGGRRDHSSMSAQGLPNDVASAVKTTVVGKIKEGLRQAGYPAKADPARMNLIGAFGVLMVFVIAATALFGPLAACLVELFPTRSATRRCRCPTT